MEWPYGAFLYCVRIIQWKPSTKQIPQGLWSCGVDEWRFRAHLRRRPRGKPHFSRIAPLNGQVPRILISAPRKSSGKTMVSIGLTAAFASRGLKVGTFKKGLDYIDPRWLGVAGGRECHNLDFFVMGREGIQRNFHRYSQEIELALIEGNMGLFDGQEMDGSDSGAALAKALDCPILLVVNCQGMARSVAPLVLGHLDFPGGEQIGGVILNNVATPRQEDKLRRVLEQYSRVPVLGVLPRSSEVVIDERHLGLVPVGEKESLASRVTAIGQHVARHLDLDQILDLAKGAGAYSWPGASNSPVLPVATPPKVRIAIATDQAFSFYYPENLAALRAAGAELIPFSFLKDSALPPVDGLYIGGGFPEMFMESLSANRALMGQIKGAVEAGFPVYAECGGLMVLAEKIHWEGRAAQMVGALPIEVEMNRRPQGYGYMEIAGTGALPWPGKDKKIRCHEFHYSQVVKGADKVKFAYRVERGSGVDGVRDGLIYRNVLASYAHIHVDGAPQWATFLVNFWQRGVGVT
ncbi:MAG: cobyrinate a,c-diamide synthase [Magnetococcales bacterium]|nr:cobyrinate a,c-diamide synthase [Magnetococcales bacterium]